MKRLWHVVVLIIGIGVFASVIPSGRSNNIVMFSNDQSGNDQNVDKAIKKLFSEDDRVRQIGRQEVIRIGSTAVKPLVNLLLDLIRDRRPRFVVEREEEGRELLKEYLIVSADTTQTHENTEQFRAISRLVINQRLSTDCISLLGELRAVEGIPVLLRIMESRGTLSSARWGIEHEALRKIGSAAIPSLISLIEHGRQHAYAASLRRPVGFGWLVSLNAEDYLEDSEDDEIEEALIDSDSRLSLDADAEWEVGIRTVSIKQQAIHIICEIGDKSALPFLENLAKTEDNQIVPTIMAAIRDIKNESAVGPAPARLKIPK